MANDNIIKFPRKTKYDPRRNFDHLRKMMSDTQN